MRKLLFSICCCSFLFIWKTNAQNSPDCRTAVPICADGQYPNFQANGSGDVDDWDPEFINAIGCLERGGLGTQGNIENNSSWYVFRAGVDGQLGFNIESLTPSGEWDFAVFGPDLDCNDISSGDNEPIRCNYENNGTGFTGVGVNPISGQEGEAPLRQNLNTYDEWLEVRQGEIYFVYINNFDSTDNGNDQPFDFTFTGSAVDADQNTAVDCSLRDEFLGLDIDVCLGSGDITLSALNSPAGSDIASIVWSVDYDDDGTIDDPNLAGSGLYNAELVVPDGTNGRYFVEITTSLGTRVADDSGVLITYFGEPILQEVITLETNLSADPDVNDIEIIVDGDGDYEYAINGGDFQDDPIFLDIPPGINTVIINDKNGCGTTEPIEFLVVGYPKFFTPNADGINDSWNIRGIETLTDPIVFVFDRYGKLLKQLGAVGGWDGTFNGRPMPSTDYWFRFEYAEQDDAALLVAKTRKTHFSLKR